MKISIILTAAAAGCLAACAGTGPRSARGGELELVEVEGYAEETGRDAAAARSLALGAAERAALERTVSLFSGEGPAAEAVLSKPSLYVKKSKVVSEKRREGFVSVKARVWVYPEKIRQAVSPARGRVAAGPLLALSVAGDPGGYGEGAFRSSALSLMGAGFTAAPPGGGAAGLLGHAAAAGAQASVEARFSARPMQTSGLGGGLAQASAEASARVLDVEGGLLAEFSVSAAGLAAGPEAAAQKALAEAGAALAREFASRLQQKLKGEARGFTLRLYGASGMDRVSSVASAVGEISPVRRVLVVSYSGGDAELAVYSDKISPEEFASAVLRAAGDFLVIDGIDKTEVAFRFIR